MSATVASLARKRINLVIEGDDEMPLAVECDGEAWQGPKQYEADLFDQRPSSWPNGDLSGVETDARLFASGIPATPLLRDNVEHRHVLPKLKKVGVAVPPPRRRPRSPFPPQNPR